MIYSISKVCITKVAINGVTAHSQSDFWIDGDLHSGTHPDPVCTEIVFNHDGSVYSSSCR